MDQQELKVCRQCNNPKPISLFRKDKRNKNGAGSPCIECYGKYLANPEVKETSNLRCKKWYEDHKDEVSQKMRGNPQKILYDRERKLKVKEKTREYNKNYYLKNREKVLALAKKYKQKNQARWKLRDMVRRGKIEPPVDCQNCKQKQKRIEAHHTDYSKPLDVLWLCVSCHKKEHYKYKDI